MPRQTKKLNLNVEIDVLTNGSIAEIINAFLEFLLYQRNQIPLVYGTYKYYVCHWNEKTTKESKTIHDIQLQQQRELAKKTVQQINALHELITKTFEKNTVKSLRFLLGSTTFTSKECYTIHIPIDAVNQDHCYKHHRVKHTSINQAILSLLTCEELYGIFSKDLNPTNLYLEMEMTANKQHSNNVVRDTMTLMYPKDFCQLPYSCKDIHIHLLQTKPIDFDANKNLRCCKELEIYEDVLRLNLKDDESLKKNKEEIPVDTNANCWWEADIIVRGFKEKPIKGLNLWMK